MHTQGELLISFRRIFPEKSLIINIDLTGLAFLADNFMYCCYSLDKIVFISLINNWQILITISFISSAEVDCIYKSEC